MLVRTRHGGTIEAGIWLIGLLIGLAAVPRAQSKLDAWLTIDAFADLQAVILTIGGAMIGATAIVSSFVLFALQVNVERLPYGLFRRFSSDFRLLGSFGLAFAIAIAGAAISLIQDKGSAALAILFSVAAVLVVLRLLLHAFRRSLELINPIQQLLIVQDSSAKQMRRFNRRVSWMIPVVRSSLEAASHEQEDDAHEERRLDQARLAVLSANAGWDNAIRQSVDHAVAYARKSGEQGDVEVSAAALAAVVTLNRLYLAAKGRTFFASFPLFHDPRVNDGFITNALEQLRRLREAALARRDEAQAEQIFRALFALTRAYFSIEYPGSAPSKYHAALAAGYLESSVKAAAHADLTDTTMAGLGVIGEAAQHFLAGDRSEEVNPLVQAIGQIGAIGLMKPDTRPITLVAVEQLTSMTYLLLRVRNSDIRFAAGQIRQSVQLLARLVLQLPDTPLSSVHNTYLAPYFSSTSFSSLRARLTPVVNALLTADKDDEGARTIAHNMSEWADDLHRDLKDLILAAVEKQSHFTFDLIHWITGICELLISAARAPATAGHTCEKLEDNAENLLLVLSWIPRDPSTGRWLEAYSFSEALFDFALMAFRRGFQVGFDRAWNLLLKWAVEAGRENTGWGTLDRTLLALVALALATPEDRSELLKKQLVEALAKSDAPHQDIRDRAAHALRAKADHFRPRQYETKRVERTLADNDRKSTLALLRGLADILSPPPVEQELPSSQ